MDDERLKVKHERVRLEPKIRGRRLKQEDKVEEWEDLDIEDFDVEKLIRKNLIRLVVSAIIFAVVFTVRVLPLSIAQKISEGVRWSLSYQMDWKDKFAEPVQIIPTMGNQIKEFVSPQKEKPEKDIPQKFLAPTEGFVITSFGEGIHPVFKTKIEARGIEIDGGAGRIIQAIKEGKVVQVQESTYGGKRIVLSHPSNMKSIYEGCYETQVEVNQEIKSGEVLGKAKSGQAIENSIVYFELWKGDQVVNPQDYIHLESAPAN